jgi:pyrroloquinoline quinone biosynthesis protein B
MEFLARVLGVAQDAGVPHVGCDCTRCEAHRDTPLYPACLGLEGAARYMIDATPAFPEQIRMLGGPPEAILLTHVHMGHVAGLLQLGREALYRRTRVHATEKVCAFLRDNAPWQRLPLDLKPIDGLVELEPGLTAEAIPVPHRDEYADTVAFLVAGPEHTLLYLPDIDRWEIDLPGLIDRCDIALLDGSFYAPGELGRQGDVPHPPITETLDLLGPEQAAKVRFLHFNHTNPVLDPDGPSVLAAVQGETIPLG